MEIVSKVLQNLSHLFSNFVNSCSFLNLNKIILFQTNCFICVTLWYSRQKPKTKKKEVQNSSLNYGLKTDLKLEVGCLKLSQFLLRVARDFL